MSSRNAAFREGTLSNVLLGPLKLCFSILFGTAMFLLCAWVTAWLCTEHSTPDGVQALRERLTNEVDYGVALAARQGAGPRTITTAANALYSLVFKTSGIHAMGVQFSRSAALSIPDTIVRRLYVSHREEIELAMIGTQLLGVRLGTLVRFVPLLLLTYIVGTADGFTQRSIRRSGGGRESASLYHRGKYMQIVVLGLGGSILLLWPGTVQWEWCVPIGALAVGVLARLQWTYYKKHL